MPRPPQPPTRDQIAPEDLAAYEQVLIHFGKPRDASPSADELPAYFAALLPSPPFAASRVELSTLVRVAGEREGTYSHHDREFVDQVLAVHMRTNVVQRTHVPDGLAVGVRAEAIAALYAGRDEDLTDDELLLATYIRQVVDGTVADAIYGRMEQRLGTRGIVEYTVFITVLWLTMRQFQAFGLPNPTDDEILALLAQARTDDGTGADWRSRIR